MRRRADREADIKAVLALIEAAANAGLPCPKNAELSDALGMMSRAGCVTIVAELEKRGKIMVERFNDKRRITILATGKSTALHGKTIPHWRDGLVASGRADRVFSSPDAPTLIRVDSRPCWNCGASGYVGCEHFPREAMAA